MVKVFEQQQHIIQDQSAKIDSLTNQELSTKGDLAKTEARLDRKIIDVKGELKTDIKDVEIRLIKWVLGVGIGGIITLSGVKFTLLKLVN